MCVRVRYAPDHIIRSSIDASTREMWPDTRYTWSLQEKVCITCTVQSTLGETISIRVSSSVLHPPAMKIVLAILLAVVGTALADTPWEACKGQSRSICNTRRRIGVYVQLLFQFFWCRCHRTSHCDQSVRCRLQCCAVYAEKGHQRNCDHHLHAV